MINFIRLDADTDHCGKVISASTAMSSDGIFVAGKGDEISCPKHEDVRLNVIVDGDESMVDDGIPIARHGYKATEKHQQRAKDSGNTAQGDGGKYSGRGYFSENIDTTSQPWIDITTGNTVDQGERMPGESAEVYGALPVKPLIYSDYPIDGEGRITQGRAMCTADCAPGMLLKLLRKGQSIWGPPESRRHRECRHQRSKRISSVDR